MKRWHKYIRKHLNFEKCSSLQKNLIAFFSLIIIISELCFILQISFGFDRSKMLAEVLPAVISLLTNKERAENNASPLTESPLLQKAAQLKADDMAKRGYFSHINPDGKLPWYYFDQVGYDYLYAGENLAVNFFDSKDVAEAWMNSPTHRANVIKKDFTQIGIGVASGMYEGKNTIFVAEFFGTPAPENKKESPREAREVKVAKTITPVETTTIKKEHKVAAKIEEPKETKVLGETTSKNWAQKILDYILSIAY